MLLIIKEISPKTHTVCSSHVPWRLASPTSHWPFIKGTKRLAGRRMQAWQRGVHHSAFSDRRASEWLKVSRIWHWSRLHWSERSLYPCQVILMFPASPHPESPKPIIGESHMMRRHRFLSLSLSSSASGSGGDDGQTKMFWEGKVRSAQAQELTSCSCRCS